MNTTRIEKCAECGRDKFRGELVLYGCGDFICTTCIESALEPGPCQVCLRAHAREVAHYGGGGGSA